MLVGFQYLSFLSDKYWHSKGIGGFGVLDYLVKAENMLFREAVEVITGATTPTAPARYEAEPPKTLILPEAVGVPISLYDYLCIKRGIDSEVVQGAVRFASLRGTQNDFRGDCSGSDKRYGFNMAACTLFERLYLYESAIDLMSHASVSRLNTQNH